MNLYEKKYKDALERASKLRVQNPFDTVSQMMEHIFPELKESEDSRIRNVIRGWLCTQPGSFFDNGISKKQMLAWLEKQGESDFEQCAREGDKIVTNEDGTRFNISQFERVTEKVAESKETAKEFLKSAEIMNGNDELADEYRPEKQCEQNSTDKVEPKFNVGNWIVFNNRHQSIYQIEKIENGYYILRHTHGGTFRVCVLHDESLRLWTIQDAKPGDVLICEDYGYTSYLLLKSFSDKTIELHCWYNEQTNNLHNGTEVITREDARIHPATKEQSETLFKAMHDAGYEWDADNKELKKIEL